MKTTENSSKPFGSILSSNAPIFVPYEISNFDNKTTLFKINQLRIKFPKFYLSMQKIVTPGPAVSPHSAEHLLQSHQLQEVS